MRLRDEIRYSVEGFSLRLVLATTSAERQVWNLFQLRWI